MLQGQELEAMKAQVKDLTTRLHQAELEAIQLKGRLQQEVAAARQEVEQRWVTCCSVLDVVLHSVLQQ
jgi:regulator of replication initiation timing